MNVRDVRAAAENDIGGGIALHPFSFGTRRLEVGDRLTEAEVRSIPKDNFNALKSSGNIHVLTKRGAQGESFLVHRGSGKYDVIQGVKLNAEPLSKEEAEALAD